MCGATTTFWCDAPGCKTDSWVFWLCVGLFLLLCGRGLLYETALEVCLCACVTETVLVLIFEFWRAIFQNFVLSHPSRQGRRQLSSLFRSGPPRRRKLVREKAKTAEGELRQQRPAQQCAHTAQPKTTPALDFFYRSKAGWQNEWPRPRVPMERASASSCVCVHCRRSAPRNRSACRYVVLCLLHQSHHVCMFSFLVCMIARECTY